MRSEKHYTHEKEIYWDLEAPFLYDYVNFANRLRPFEAAELQHKEFNMQQDGKRIYLVLLTELYQKSLEDLAAILLALYRRFNLDSGCGYQKKFSQTTTPLTYTIINYKVGEATIKKVTDRCPSERDFITKLHINDLETLNINLLMPLLSVPSFYGELYKNILDWMEDQQKRFRMYNKIKHGPVVIGSAKLLNNKNENAPAVIYSDESANLTDHPLIVHSLHFTEEEFILLQHGTLKVSDCIRDLLAIYLCKSYPDFLVKQGFSSPLLFFTQRRPKTSNEKS